MIGPEVYAAAQRYEAHGLRLVEVHLPGVNGCSCGNAGCGSPGKHPRRSSWTQATSSSAAFANGVLHNIGIVTGAASGIVVIDVDAGGEETLGVALWQPFESERDAVVFVVVVAPDLAQERVREPNEQRRAQRDPPAPPCGLEQRVERDLIVEENRQRTELETA